MLQMEFTDRLIGTALRRLREAGSYDDALIIVTADHGVSFRAGGYRRRLDASNAADIMPVPLLIKRPHQKEPAIDDRNAEIVDIVPTVAGVLGVEVPWDVDGVSLFGPDPKRPGKRAFQQHSSPTSQVFNGPPSVLEMIMKEVERRDRLFEDLHNPVAISGHANLHPGVGQRLPETATQRSDLLTLEIGSRQSPAREEPACDGLQPISGSVAIGGPVGSPIVLAVSVNGVVRTYTRAIPTSESSASFVAFLEAPHAQLETVGVHLIGAGVGEVTTLRLRK
jgi:hypothetical protein